MKHTTSRHRSRKPLWALLHATALLVVTYLLWNIPMNLTDGGWMLKGIRVAKSTVNVPDTLPSELMLINTCYDRAMIPAINASGEVMGQLDITDREKLLALLQALQRENDYRYVVCDIRFDGSFKSQTDSALFSLLSQMPRCCIPYSSTMTSLPTKLKAVAATSEYNTSIFDSDFLKYQYLSPTGEGMALKMAHEMNGTHIGRWGPFYAADGKLCLNSHIVDIETNVRNEYDPYGRKNILHLGTDILPILDLGVTGMFTDKIVMIGDCFLSDMHNTVAGKASGMMIIYNAYNALAHQRNVPPLWLWLALLLVYFTLTQATLYHFEPHDLLRMLWLKDKPLLCILCDWMGFQILFTLLALIAYYYADIYIDAWIFSTYFTVFEKIHIYQSTRKTSNKR